MLFRSAAVSPFSRVAVESGVAKHTPEKWSTVYYASGSKGNQFPTRTLMFLRGHLQPTPPPETPGPSQASLGESLVDSLLLSPGSWCTQGLVQALQKSVSQSCIISDGSMVDLMATSTRRAYSTPKSAAPRAPALVASHR